jgi:hypothetical protein
MYHQDLSVWYAEEMYHQDLSVWYDEETYHQDLSVWYDEEMYHQDLSSQSARTLSPFTQAILYIRIHGCRVRTVM